MKTHSFFNRLFHSPILRLAAGMVLVLAWGSLAFCGEIHDAAANGDLEKVKALLKDKPDLVSSRDAEGETPLHLAASRNGPVLVCAQEMKSLTVGADGRVIAAEGTVTRLSIGSTVVELEKNELGVEDGYAIVFTKQCGKLKMKIDSVGQGTVVATPAQRAALEKLYEADGHPYKEVVKLLLASKAEVDAKDDQGQTPLLWAALTGHNETVKLLLSNKAEVNAKNKFGHTPLLLAAWKGHNDVVASLLANKADVNAKDNDGSTPLHWAVRAGQKDTAVLLLAHKADANAKDSDGATPLALAIKNGDNDLAKLLRQHGGRG